MYLFLSISNVMAITYLFICFLPKPNRIAMPIINEAVVFPIPRVIPIKGISKVFNPIFTRLKIIVAI